MKQDDTCNDKANAHLLTPRSMDNESLRRRIAELETRLNEVPDVSAWMEGLAAEWDQEAEHAKERAAEAEKSGARHSVVAEWRAVARTARRHATELRQCASVDLPQS